MSTIPLVIYLLINLTAESRMNHFLKLHGKYFGHSVAGVVSFVLCKFSVGKYVIMVEGE